MVDVKKLNCCDVMVKAQTEGTDCEGWQAFVKFREEEPCSFQDGVSPAGFYAGQELPMIKFCPWCGKEAVA